MFTRQFFSLVVAVSISLFVASSARAQYKLETCEDLKITEKQYGISVVETAICINPTKTFSPKGTLRNVNIVYSFPPVPTGAGVTFMVTKNDANGEYVENKDYMVSPNHRTAYARCQSCWPCTSADYSRSSNNVRAHPAAWRSYSVRRGTVVSA